MTASPASIASRSPKPANSSTDGCLVQARPDIVRLPRYRPGKPVRSVPGLTGYKLSSNETPFGPLPEVIEAVAEAATYNIYPDPSALPLREELAQLLEVPVDNIVAGTGSLAVLNDIIQAFAGRDELGVSDEVIYAWRSFESYPISVGATGAAAVPVALTSNYAHDLEGMLNAITERTKIIILCTPNNPTGPALTHTEVIDFLNRVPANVMVILDEAYVEYVRGEDRLDAISVYRQFANVVVLRTFSKAHGLAALRVGFCIAHEHITQYLATIAVPFSVPQVSQVAAITSLRHLPRVLERVDATVRERQALVDALLEAGAGVPDAQGNFVWLPLGDRSAAFTQLCADNAISVRPFLDEGVRVSIGERAANDRVLALYLDMFPRGGSHNRLD